MPQKMDVFATAFYDNQYIVTINGHNAPKYPLKSFRRSINLTSLAVWQSFDDINTQFVQNTSTSEVTYNGQSSVQIKNTVYGIPKYDNYEGYKLFKYDLVSNKYYDKSTYKHLLPQPSYRSCVSYIKHKLYIIGGQIVGKGITNIVQIYDVSLDEWNQSSSTLNKPRRDAGCSSVNDQYLYIFGGYKASHLDSIEKYKLENNEWMLLNITLDIARDSHRCVYVNNTNQYIYCIGGKNDNFGALNSAEIFDTKTELIISANFINITLNIARLDHGLLNINNQYLLVLGGNDYQHYDSIEQLQLEPFNLNTTSPTNQPTVEPTMLYLSPTLEPTVEPTLEPTIIISDNTDQTAVIHLLIIICIAIGGISIVIIVVLRKKCSANKVHNDKIIDDYPTPSSHRVEMNRETNLKIKPIDNEQKNEYFMGEILVISIGNILQTKAKIVDIDDFWIRVQYDDYKKTVETLHIINDDHRIQKMENHLEGQRIKQHEDAMSDSEKLYISRQTTVTMEGNQRDKISNTTDRQLLGNDINAIEMLKITTTSDDNGDV